MTVSDAPYCDDTDSFRGIINKRNIFMIQATGVNAMRNFVIADTAAGKSCSAIYTFCPSSLIFVSKATAYAP
jgi:hypothetical protein